MFQPFETTINLWLTAMPRFEWEAEPTPPPTTEGGDAVASSAPDADNGDAAAGRASSASRPTASGIASLPTMRLVFKGYHWVAVPVWGLRENANFEQVARTQRDDDQRRLDERGRHARKVAADTGDAPSWDAPQSPTGPSRAKLDGEGT